MTLTEQLAFHFEDYEIWKPVVGYEWLYEVSSKGQVRSLDRPVYRGNKIHCYMKGRILKQTKTTTGYMRVTLVKPGNKNKMFRVHRLVATAFIQQIEGKELINHIDSNPINNDVSNLEWCTHSENLVHAYHSGERECSIRNKEKWIIQAYLEDRNSGCNTIAKKIGTDSKTIKRLLEQHGIPIRSRKEVRTKVPYEILVSEFKKGSRNIDIAQKYNISTTTVKKYKREFKEGLGS
ncbi:NUMOD4 motif-containing HNH endonuclease [Lysinibacillus fusiformis]|uniref:NUMOD4 motif-containing HNH endonuclease n=1 Tax=Lysinibacillus fusiformis TaxID=28031 RepID=UPI0037AD5EA6